MKIKEGFVGQSMLVLPPLKLKKAASHPFLKLLYPTAIGYYPLASYHERERPEGTGDYILLYCVDGQGFVEEHGERTILSPNTFYILSKNVAHRYGSTPKKPWSIYWIHFNGKQADALFDRYVVNRGKYGNVLAYDKGRNDTFNYLLHHLQKDLDDALSEVLYIHLLHYLSSFTHLTGHVNHDVEDAVAKIRLFMQENITENFELKDLADRANYSVTHFSQLFKSRTGYAPIQYFLQLKIQYACQYLSFTKMNIRQISQTLGFNDPFYFSRAFKKLTGMSPLTYRKQNNNLPISQ